MASGQALKREIPDRLGALFYPYKVLQLHHHKPPIIQGLMVVIIMRKLPRFLIPLLEKLHVCWFRLHKKQFCKITFLLWNPHETPVSSTIFLQQYEVYSSTTSTAPVAFLASSTSTNKSWHWSTGSDLTEPDNT